MLDQSKDSNEQSIAFNLNNIQTRMPSTFLLKVSSFSEEGESDSIDNQFDDDAHTSYDSFFQVNDDQDDEPLHQDMFEQLTLQQKSTQDPDAIVFGFPLNFN